MRRLCGRFMNHDVLFAVGVSLGDHPALVTFAVGAWILDKANDAQADDFIIRGSRRSRFDIPRLTPDEAANFCRYGATHGRAVEKRVAGVQLDSVEDHIIR